MFRTLAGPKISRVELVGERIFVAANTEVRVADIPVFRLQPCGSFSHCGQVAGFSKKGKNFFNISTFMTETIRSMYVIVAEVGV